jgi:hypothetical protein
MRKKLMFLIPKGGIDPDLKTFQLSGQQQRKYSLKNS